MKTEKEIRSLVRDLEAIDKDSQKCGCLACLGRRAKGDIIASSLMWVLGDHPDADRAVEQIASEAAKIRKEVVRD